MFRRLGHTFFTFATAQKSTLYRFTRTANFKTCVKTLTFASVPALMYYNHIFPFSLPTKEEPKAETIAQVSADPKLIENPKTVWEKFKSSLAHFVRFFHLIAIFLPSILALPLRLFKTTEKLWLRIFVSSVERAGVVWIKAFQYLSHRRDVIGPEMAEGFTHLRENAPQHSFE